MVRTYLVVISAFLLLQMSFSTPHKTRRDVPQTNDGVQDVEESVTNTLDSWKEGFENLLKDTVQVDQLVANLSSELQIMTDRLDNLSRRLSQSLGNITLPIVAPAAS